MSKAKKILLSVTCAGLLVVGSVAATIAYLTDEESVENTFTVGDVQILLDETDFDQDENKKDVTPGSVTTENPLGRDKANAYHLIPGQSYVKDPTVTVLKGSDESYVRMMVTVENLDQLKAALPKEENPEYYAGDVFLLQMMVKGWDEDVWAFEGVQGNVYEFRYTETTDKSEDEAVLPALFEEIMVPGAIDNDNLEKLEDVKVVVEAHAIQAAGFKNADEAWAKFN